MGWIRCPVAAVLAFCLSFAFPILTAQEPIGAVRSALERLLEKDGYGKRRAAILARISSESVEFNERGYQAYAEEKYPEAEKFFRRALGADPGNTLAAYNLACVLSLAERGRTAAGTKPEGAARLKEIVRFLCRAAAGDVHWALKLFLDPDLSGSRGKGFSCSAFLPCPGDYGPDQWYEFLPDGRLRYGAGNTDLSGLSPSSPDIEAEGYYAVFGDYVLTYLPDRPAIVSRWHSVYSAEDGGEAGPGAQPGEAFLVFQAKRYRPGASVREVSALTDLWE